MLKRAMAISVSFLLSFAYKANPQDLPSAEQQLENLADIAESETEDDSWLQAMEQFRKDPVDLNTAGPAELKELRILTDLQIENLIAYRKLLGKLLAVYELQAVPCWDLLTIKKLLPFIRIGVAVSLPEKMGTRLKEGEHSLLFRISQTLEKSAGYIRTPARDYYKGSPQRMFFRYRYQYRNLLQYGVTGDKDAGEQFFKGDRRYGFDFYSFHLFARRAGIVQALALGDFTVNMGQGLIQWQSLAFKKSVDIAAIKRQSAVLRPYNSAGEFNFHRGAGITIRKGNIEATVFASFRRLTANVATDTLYSNSYFSSFNASGYHRTQSELNDRNSLRQFSAGANISLVWNNLHLGWSGVSYRFSHFLQKRREPYNLYAITGKDWNNCSIDYSYTYRNAHLFGEIAIDKHFHKAAVQGLLVSMDPKADLSIVYRSVSKAYQSVSGNAFTENTSPGNESGLYTGICIRPVPGIKLDAYTDMYRFPWLKYRVHAPSSGQDFLVQLSYTPNKRLEISTRYRNESRQINPADDSTAIMAPAFMLRQDWRTQVRYTVDKSLEVRHRFELIWYNKRKEDGGAGFLAFVDVILKPPLLPVSGSWRLQYFETEGYDTRMYAYENDLLYNYSIPVFFDKGWRYYLNISYNINTHLSCWLKWGQTIYVKGDSIGSGLDEIEGNKKSEIKLQFAFYL